MDLGGASVSGPRPYNEDTYFFADLSERADALGGLTAFAIVCDGMGGHQSGDVASRVAVEAAQSYVEDLIAMAAQSRIELDVAQALREIASEAHQAVMRAAAERGGSSMGATLVAAFLSDTELWVGHVGDSRAYLLHDGTARPVTVDHSQVGRMIAEGILTEEQAQHHPQRNVIERALGFEGTTAEITHVEVRSGDALMLCSDGLSTVLSGADIATIAIEARSAADAARMLTEEAVKAGTDDNTTAVVVCDDWQLFRASAPRRAEGRRQASKQRRDAQRHRRASRASIVFGAIALLVVGGIAFAAIMGTRPTGGGQAATPTASPSAVTTRTVEATGSATGAEWGDMSFSANATINASSNLRVEPSTEASAVVKTRPGSGVRAYVDQTAPMKDAKGDLWYKVPRSELRRMLQAEGAFPQKGYDSSNLPDHVWVREDIFKLGAD